MDPKLLKALTATSPLDEGYALDLSEPQMTDAGYGQLTRERTEAALAQLARQERGPMGPAEAHRYNEGLQPLTGGTNWDTEAQDAFATTPPGRAIERMVNGLFEEGEMPEGHYGGSPAIFDWISGPPTMRQWGSLFRPAYKTYKGLQKVNPLGPFRSFS